MMAAIRGGSAGPLPQRSLWIDATRLARRYQSERQRRHGGHREREEQARGIHTDRLRNSSGQRAGGQRRECERGPRGDHKPGGGATCRQDEAFDDELADETSAAGTERRTHRKLATTSDAAGHQQPGEIQTGDCKHRRHNRHQQPQSGTRFSHEMLVQAGDEHRHSFIDAILRSERGGDHVHFSLRRSDGDTGAQAAVALEGA